MKEPIIQNKEKSVTIPTIKAVKKEGKEKKVMKLNPPPIAQKKPAYSIIEDLASALAHITFE